MPRTSHVHVNAGGVNKNSLASYIESHMNVHCDSTDVDAVDVYPARGSHLVVNRAFLDTVNLHADTYAASQGVNGGLVAIIVP